MTDIVERLRHCYATAPVQLEAAGTIEYLRAEVERLRAERDDFYMDYRMKCDRETKALEVVIAGLKAETEQWTTWGVIEVAIRNPAVAEYMQHWEGRAEKAEAEVEALRADAERWRMFLSTMTHETHDVICAAIDAARSKP
jgi:hypothetical protein